MRALLYLSLAMIGCHGSSGAHLDLDAPATIDASPDAPDAGPDHLKELYDEVDGTRIIQTLKEMSGVVPVLVNGETITIDERYSDAGRQRFRDYWTQQMTALGLTVTPMHYQAAGHPRAGDNLEAVLPGASADSFVIIVHYDSIGPDGAETANPGADDDMSGMAIELETARLLVAHAAQLHATVRFVASDEEELGGLAGARDYASYIKAKSQAEGFALVAAIDDEQTGWNCHTDNLCGDDVWPAFDVFSCGMNQTAIYQDTAMGDAFAAIITKYSPLAVSRGCLGENSDHFAMWEIGVHTIVFSEHNPFANPHFDQNGGDTFDKIDTDYLVSIARPAITFQATLAGFMR
jgi:hypothetical protein